MRHGHTENGDSKDDTFYALIKLKILRNFMKVLPWNWLKWRGKSVPKECCSNFSHPLSMEHVLDEVLGPALDNVEKTRAKNCSEPFCNH